MDFAALSATSCNVDLSGHWHALARQENGSNVSFGVQLDQYGIAVFGRMQCKFAADPPLKIRGIVHDQQLIANCWRSDGENVGSGVFTLAIIDAGHALLGKGTWNSTSNGFSETSEWRWERTGENNPKLPPVTDFTTASH
jgi:hypothetical protein